MLRKKLVMQLIFCMQVSMKACYKLMLRFFNGDDFLSVPKVSKIASLQYLYNISKKKLGMQFIFCMQINIKTSATWIIVFDESSQICPKYPIQQNFCNILKKVLQLILCSAVMQNGQIVYGVPVMFVVTCFWEVVVENGSGCLDHGTLKSAESQE